MLGDEQLDLLSIATWKDSHCEMLELALWHEVPGIVCEKPISERLEHADAIVREVERTGTHLFVNHRRRCDPLVYELRAALRNGRIGEVLQVSTYYVYGLVTTGTHLIDTLRMLLQDVAGEIRWVIGMDNPFSLFSPDDDPCIDGWLGFDSGLKVSVQSLSMKDYDIFDLHFYGRGGKIVFRNIGRDVDYYDVIDSPEHAGFTELRSEPVERRGGEPRNQFRFLADHMIHCLEGKATSLSTGRDSLMALKVLLAMQRSAAAGGRRVEV
jgi:predicted dehydrogenase